MIRRNSFNTKKKKKKEEKSARLKTQKDSLGKNRTKKSKREKKTKKQMTSCMNEIMN